MICASGARADGPVVPPPLLPSPSLPSASSSTALVGVGIFIGVVGAICLFDFLQKVSGRKPWVDPKIGEPHLKRN